MQVCIICIYRVTGDPIKSIPHLEILRVKFCTKNSNFDHSGGLPKHPRLLLMRLTYSVLCDSMQEVGSASNMSCKGSYQQPHYYYYILRRFTATVKGLLLQATKYKYSKLFGIPFKEKY